jgi:hypothetical protein
LAPETQAALERTQHLFQSSLSIVARAIYVERRLLCGAEADADHDRLTAKGTILNVALITSGAVDLQHQRTTAPRTLGLMELDGAHCQTRLELSGTKEVANRHATPRTWTAAQGSPAISRRKSECRDEQDEASPSWRAGGKRLARGLDGPSTRGVSNENAEDDAAGP